MDYQANSKVGLRAGGKRAGNMVERGHTVRGEASSGGGMKRLKLGRC